jgi:hypothetical protein
LNLVLEAKTFKVERRGKDEKEYDPSGLEQQ